MKTVRRLWTTATHGGAGRAGVRGGRVSALHPIAPSHDTSPSRGRAG